MDRENFRYKYIRYLCAYWSHGKIHIIHFYSKMASKSSYGSDTIYGIPFSSEFMLIGRVFTRSHHCFECDIGGNPTRFAPVITALKNRFTRSGIENTKPGVGT